MSSSSTSQQSDDQKNSLALDSARKRIALTWYLGSGLIFSLILFQTIFGKYGDRVQEAWSWALPNIMPTLSIITSVFVVNAYNDKTYNISTDRFTYKLAFYSSLAYMVTVNLIVILSPISVVPPLQLMQISNIWLGPFQGLVSITIGLFFITQD